MVDIRLHQLLHEHFNCAPGDFTFNAPHAALGDTGYFRFGSENICYGSLVKGRVAKSVDVDLYDVTSETAIDDSHCDLPFSPSEVIDNLRYERYVLDSSDKGQHSTTLVRQAYYLVRPLLAVGFRKHLQRYSLKHRDCSSFPAWPVDCSVEHIFRHLLALKLQSGPSLEIPFIWFWPEGRSACGIMTHDVETAAGLASSAALMDIDDSHQIKSSFQLIPGGRYVLGSEILGEMRRRAFEINVHDWDHDGRLFSNEATFMRRIEKINKAGRELEAEGFRSGALYRNAVWLQRLKMSYDMSVPNVGRMDPQSGGCCTVFPYFIGDLLELPVTCIQDYSLFHILGDYSLSIWKDQLRAIIAMNGLASFIVHPDYLVEGKAQSTYAELLQYLSQLRDEGTLWIAKPGEVARWWRQRRNMKLVKRANRWEVEGEGHDQAVVAYATWDGESLRYRLGEASPEYDSAVREPRAVEV